MRRGLLLPSKISSFKNAYICSSGRFVPEGHYLYITKNKKTTRLKTYFSELKYKSCISIPGNDSFNDLSIHQ